MDTKQITDCALQIEKLTTERRYGDVMRVLADLEDVHVTDEQLQTTDIVKVLYKVLKTSPDHSIKKSVKCLLSKWKKQYRHSPQTLEVKGDLKRTECIQKANVSDGDFLIAGSPSSSNDEQDVLTQAVSHTSSHQQQTHVDEKDGVLDEKQCTRAHADEDWSPLARGKHETTFSNLHSEVEHSRPPAATTESTPASSNEDSAVRSKCVQLLLSALTPETPAQSEHAEKAVALARDLEKHIHALHAVSQAKYKACVRSKVANLRNPKTRHLRQGLLSGALGPEAFTRMSTEEMASAELQRLRSKYSSQGVSERQLPQGVEGTATQKIRCRRCEGTECTVTQVSRGTLFLPAWVRGGGPDEDAMTFVTCSGCGQQWYHSNWTCL